MLKRSGQRLSWLGGKPGYTGFDSLVTSSLGVKFNEQLNLMIDRKIAKFVDDLERTHQKGKKVLLPRVRHRRDGADRKKGEG